MFPSQESGLLGRQSPRAKAKEALSVRSSSFEVEDLHINSGLADPQHLNSNQNNQHFTFDQTSDPPKYTKYANMPDNAQNDPESGKKPSSSLCGCNIFCCGCDYTGPETRASIHLYIIIGIVFAGAILMAYVLVSSLPFRLPCLLTTNSV
jgi:hypothetical protein